MPKCGVFGPLDTLPEDGDTLVMDTGADATTDGGYNANSGSMSADEGM